MFNVVKFSSEKTYKRIEDTCGNILYYVMKTNTAWALYPVLLTVLHRSGHEVGNINHSRYGTILGLSMLVVLLESEVDKTVKIAGINLVRNKEGVYLANEIFDILTSPDHLNLSVESIQSKISGMVGDGAFCKSNEPFKSQMKYHFGDSFKFRWDLLHLVN